jgi:hypothetical protein
VLGATDRRLKAVVAAQVPTIDGHAAVDDLKAQFADDERAQLRGERPATQGAHVRAGLVHRARLADAAADARRRSRLHRSPTSR